MFWASLVIRTLSSWSFCVLLEVPGNRFFPRLYFAWLPVVFPPRSLLWLRWVLFCCLWRTWLFFLLLRVVAAIVWLEAHTAKLPACLKIPLPCFLVYSYIGLAIQISNCIQDRWLADKNKAWLKRFIMAQLWFIHLLLKRDIMVTTH